MSGRKQLKLRECDMCSCHCGVTEDSNALACDTISLEIWFGNVLPSPARFLWSIHLYGPLNV